MFSLHKKVLVHLFYKVLLKISDAFILKPKPFFAPFTTLLRDKLNWIF